MTRASAAQLACQPGSRELPVAHESTPDDFVFLADQNEAAVDQPVLDEESSRRAIRSERFISGPDALS